MSIASPTSCCSTYRTIEQAFLLLKLNPWRSRSEPFPCFYASFFGGAVSVSQARTSCRAYENAASRTDASVKWKSQKRSITKTVPNVVSSPPPKNDSTSGALCKRVTHTPTPCRTTTQMMQQKQMARPIGFSPKPLRRKPYEMLSLKSRSNFLVSRVTSRNRFPADV